MSAPPPPPRRARGPVEPTPPVTDTGAPAPPPRRRSPAPAPDAPVETGVTVAAPAPTATHPPPGPTRAERRAAAASGARTKSARSASPPSQKEGANGGGRRRVLVVAAIVLVVLLAVGGAFAAGVFSGSGGGGDEPLQASTNVKLERGEVKVRWPGSGPGQTDPELQNQLITLIGKYVDEGIVPALRTGTVQTAALSNVFDEAALSQLDTPEARAAMLDERQPKAIGKLAILAPPIRITALNDNDNKTVLATAYLILDIRAQSDKGFYEVTRKGQLVFAPQLDGSWKVTGWHMNVSRTPPRARAPWITTTTAAKSSKKP
jgi:flagellar basal body-associated protein FliL